MFLPYARVLRTPGVRPLYAAGVLGALALSMVTPGVLLLVGDASGSLARAGLASGALTVGNGVGLVVQGRLIDRYGLRRVLVPAGAGCAVAFAALAVAARRDTGTAGLVAVAGLAGCLVPAVLTGVRRLLPEAVATGDRPSAYALLAVLSQVCSITGPVVVSATLVLHRPVLPVLGTGVVAAVGAGVLVAAGPARRWRPAPVSRGPSWAPTPGLLTLLVAAFGTGVAIGAVNAAIPAVALAHGSAGVALAGPLFTCLAVGDLLGGIGYGARRWRSPLHHRLTRSLLAGTAAVVALAAATRWPLALAPLLVVFGAVFAVPGVTTSTLLDSVTAPGRLAASYTALVAATLAGAAAGTSAAGAADQTTGPWTAFLLAAAVLLTTTLLTRRRATTLQPPKQPDRSRRDESARRE